MTYRELFDLYRRGELDEKAKLDLEKDIEKYDAIGEYLFDNEVDFSKNESGAFDGENNDTNNYQDASIDIKKSIRKAFVKMGVVVGVVVLLIGAFVTFALPKVVDLLYYNPTKSIYKKELLKKYDYQDVNRFEADMKIYGELFLPLTDVHGISLESKGYGSYDFNISKQTRNTSIDGAYSSVNGKLERNKITFYDPNAFKKPVGNAFEWQGYEFDFNKRLSQQMGKKRKVTEYDEKKKKEITKKEVIEPLSMAGDPENSKENIKELLDGPHKAYINLDRIMSYKEVCKFVDKYDISYWWCCVSMKNIYTHNMGFKGDLPSYYVHLKLDGYPYLFGYEADSNGRRAKGEYRDIAQQHFISMLKYIREQKTFNKTISNQFVDDLEWIKFKDMEEYIKKNGLKICGIVVFEKKDKLLKLFEDKDVYSIGVE